MTTLLPYVFIVAGVLDVLLILFGGRRTHRALFLLGVAVGHVLALTAAGLYVMAHAPGKARRKRREGRQAPAAAPRPAVNTACPGLPPQGFADEFRLSGPERVLWRSIETDFYFNTIPEPAPREGGDSDREP